MTTSSATSEAPHWFAQYNQVHRRRLEYMQVARHLQSLLPRVSASVGSQEWPLECLRTKARHLNTCRSPIVWNQKACTCDKCQAASYSSYMPGILHLASHNSVTNTSAALLPALEQRRLVHQLIRPAANQLRTCRSEPNGFRNLVDNGTTTHEVSYDNSMATTSLSSQNQLNTSFRKTNQYALIPPIIGGSDPSTNNIQHIKTKLHSNSKKNTLTNHSTLNNNTCDISPAFLIMPPSKPSISIPSRFRHQKRFKDDKEVLPPVLSISNSKFAPQNSIHS